MSVVPDGGEQLAALSRALLAAGEKGLARELDKGVREPLKALMPKIEASQLEKLPQRGGMAETMRSRTKLKVQRRNTGRYPGVRLVASYPGRIGRLDQGRLRHPTFADDSQAKEEWDWVTQAIPAGWFSEPVDEAHPAILAAANRALDEVARQVDVDMSRSKTKRG